MTLMNTVIVIVSSDIIEGAPKRPSAMSASDLIFWRYLKKFKKSDEINKDVNRGLANVINNAFHEGILDDTYNELIELIHSKGLVKNKIF